MAGVSFTAGKGVCGSSLPGRSTGHCWSSLTALRKNQGQGKGLNQREDRSLAFVSRVCAEQTAEAHIQRSIGKDQVGEKVGDPTSQDPSVPQALTSRRQIPWLSRE